MSTPTRPALPAALLIAGAGAIHLAAAVPHLRESAVLGTAFVATGWAQLLLGALLTAERPGRGAVLSGIVLGVVAATAWALSRTVGLPILHPEVEQVGTAGIVTVTLELLSVAALTWALLDLRPPSIRTAYGAVVLAALLTLGASSAAIAGLAHEGADEAPQQAIRHEARVSSRPPAAPGTTLPRRRGR